MQVLKHPAETNVVSVYLGVFDFEQTHKDGRGIFSRRFGFAETSCVDKDDQGVEIRSIKRRSTVKKVSNPTGVSGKPQGGSLVLMLLEMEDLDVIFAISSEHSGIDAST